VAHDEEILEPLPVEVDGELVEPAPVERAVCPDMHAVAAAVRATIADAAQVRGGVPWGSGEWRPVSAVQSAKTAHFVATFTRMVAVHPRALDTLDEWWARCERDDTVEIANRLVLEAPRRDEAGTWRLRGRLRSPGRLRRLPVELLLWPRLGAWTKISLEPVRDVHVGRRYFRSGHRVLDSLTARLMDELAY
jgi:hypothetical protein